jgi:DNA processing protein
MHEEELLNRIAVTWHNRTRQRQLRTLLDSFDSVTEALARHPELANREALQHAKQELNFIEKHNITTYFYRDDNYPYRLAQCVDAPLMLYAKGNLQVNPKHAVSIVGTRQPSERGKDWCRRLVLDLAAQIPDLTIISGLAYGIDVIAHKAAIEAGIPTIIIPAHGLDRIYPAAHRNVAIQSLSQGGILTEYTCGTEPERHNFVARNRIVAGMADAVVVVESKKKGGSLITANMAIDYGRDVFALPGRYDDICSAGCNSLIKTNQAQLIEDADDLINAMQWQPAHSEKPVQTTLLELCHDLTPTQMQLVQLLRETEDGLHINQIVMETQLAYHTISSELIMLELQDIVKSMPGGIWRIKK